jgi:hypothetical protein
VLTGETTPEMLVNWPAEGQPTFVLDRIDKLIPEALWKEYGWTEDDA